MGGAWTSPVSRIRSTRLPTANSVSTGSMDPIFIELKRLPRKTLGSYPGQDRLAVIVMVTHSRSVTVTSSHGSRRHLVVTTQHSSLIVGGPIAPNRSGATPTSSVRVVANALLQADVLTVVKRATTGYIGEP